MVEHVADAAGPVDQRQREHPGQPAGVRRHQQTTPGQPGRQVDGVPPCQQAEHDGRHRAPARRAGPSRRAAAGTTARARPSPAPPAPPCRGPRAPAPGPDPPWRAPVARVETVAVSTVVKPRGDRGRGRPAALPTLERMDAACDLVLPCRDEGPALEGLLPRVPDDLPRDRRRQRLDRRHRRRRPSPRRDGGRPRRRPGYGAAVHAGLEAATAEYVAFMDGDGSFDPRRARAAARRRPRGPRRPGGRAAAPGRVAASGRGTPVPATRWSSPGCGTASGCRPTTSRRCASAAARPCWTSDVRDRRVRLPRRAAAAGRGRAVALRRARRHLPPPRRGHPLQGVRLGDGHAADRPRLRAGAVDDAGRASWSSPRRPCPAWRRPASAPRSAWTCAAELAAAALLDTLRACVATVGVARCRLALEGDLTDRRARRPAAPPRSPAGRSSRSAATGLAERLASAHLDAGRRAPGPVVQIGMDTPQVTAADLTAVADGARRPRRRARPRRGRRLVGAGAGRPAPWRAPGRRPDVHPDHGGRDAGGPRGRRPQRRPRPRCCATSTPSTTPRPSPPCAPRTRLSPSCGRRVRADVEASGRGGVRRRLPRPPVRVRRARTSPGSTSPPTRWTGTLDGDRAPCSTSAPGRRSTSAAAPAG